MKTILRERLGEQLESESSHSLQKRIDELTDATIRYQNENLTLTSSNKELATQIRTHEDDLAAARTSLRRMIRERTELIENDE